MATCKTHHCQLRVGIDHRGLPALYCPVCERKKQEDAKRRDPWRDDDVDVQEWRS